MAHAVLSPFHNTKSLVHQEEGKDHSVDMVLSGRDIPDLKEMSVFVGELRELQVVGRIPHHPLHGHLHHP